MLPGPYLSFFICSAYVLVQTHKVTRGRRNMYQVLSWNLGKAVVLLGEQIVMTRMHAQPHNLQGTYMVHVAVQSPSYNYPVLSTPAGHLIRIIIKRDGPDSCGRKNLRSSN